MVGVYAREYSDDHGAIPKLVMASICEERARGASKNELFYLFQWAATVYDSPHYRVSVAERLGMS